MHIRRHVSFVMALVMSMLFCLPMAHASDTSAVSSAPLTYNTNARNGMVRVHLSSLGRPTALDVMIAGSYSISGHHSMTLASGETVSISFNPSTGQITLIRNGQSYQMGQEMVFRRHQTSGSNGLKIAQAKKPANLYPGDLQLKAQYSSGSYRLYPIVHVYIESYLNGVVPYEMGNSAPLEALKAQAVAARTYTLNKMDTRASQLYDVVDTTNDQVYYGNSDSTANCTAAVNATKGIVLMNGGALTSTYYTASNGGQTESAKNFWNSSNLAYLTVKDDPFDLMNSDSVLRKLTVYADNDSSAQKSALKNILYNKAISKLASMGYATAGLSVTRITGVTPHTPKYASPSRLYTLMDFDLTVSTASGTVNTTVTCDIFSELESALGMSINATQNELWSVMPSGQNFIIQVRRYGHGVGMSQRGAMQMGSLGYTYDQILGFYYENCQRVQYTFTHTILSAIGTGDSTITNTEPPADIITSGGSYATVKLVGLSDLLPIRYAADVQGKILTAVINGGMVNVLAKGNAWTMVQYGRIIGYVPTSSLSFAGTAPAASDQSPTNVSQWATVTASGSLNLRSSASTGAQVLTRIPTGAVLCVFSVSGGWAQVQYGAQSGYASTDFLSLSSSYPGEITVSSSSAMVHIPSGSGSVNLRQTASTTSAVVTTIPHGESVEIITNDGSWCQARYGSNQGYIMCSFLRFGQGGQDNSESNPTMPELGSGKVEAIVKTAATSLNLRAQASTQSAVLGSIPRGESVIVTSRGSDWCAVRYGGLNGYVMTQYLSFPSDGQQLISGYATVQTASGGLNLRSKPQAGSTIVTTIPRGAQVGVIEWGDSWSHVSYESYSGYAMSTYLRREGQSSESTVPSAGSAIVNTTSGSLNLRQSPDAGAGVIVTIPKGDQVEVLVQGSEWTQVRWNGHTGYVMSRYLSFGTSSATTSAWVATSGGQLNLRETASAWAAVLASIPNGAEITVTEKGESWCRVSWQGLTGYVMTDYLSFTGPQQSSTKAWIVTNVTGGVNVRQEPSFTSTVVTTLSPGTQITLKGRDGEWCAVTWNGVSGYVHGDYVTTSDPAPAKVIRYVNTSSGGLNLRETASAQARVLMSIPRSAAVEVKEVQGEWCRIEYEGNSGYVMISYLSDTRPETITTPESSAAVYDPTLVDVPSWHAVINATTALNIRQWCAMDAPIITSIPAGIQVDLKQVGDTWCRIQYEGVDGYCMTNYLTLLPAMP